MSAPLLAVLFLALFAGQLQAQLVWGHVVDSITGAPVPETVVILTGLDEAEAARTNSDAQGFFMLRAPSPGSYYLVAAHAGYRSTMFPPFELESERSFVLLISALDAVLTSVEQDNEELIDRLCPNSAAGQFPVIVGRVTDAISGESTQGARVFFSMPVALIVGTDSAPLRVTEDRGVVVTDGDGMFAVCEAPVMSWISTHAIDGDRRSGFEAVLFGAGGVFRGGAFHPMARPLWRQDLELFPADEQRAVLSGSVVDTAGNVLDGATVEIIGTPYNTLTDRSGSFEFSNLTRGHVRVRAKKIGYAPSEYDVDLSPGQEANVPPGMLALSQFSIRLRDIIVMGEALGRNPNLAGFFERRATIKLGRFATREDWKLWISSFPSEIITRLRGLRGRDRTCFDPNPTPRYFLDGMYLGSAATFELDDIPVDWLDAMEVYPSASDAPVRYRRSPCAPIVLMWTRPR